MPAYRAPRPTPSSSAISSSSPMPPSGPGPEQATAVARPPLRSSPAQATPGEQPADGQRPGHPHGHLGAVHHDAEGLDAGRDHRLQRVHGAVHIALPGVGEETGRPDPATALRATGFAPHRAQRSSPAAAASRTITRPEGTRSMTDSRRLPAGLQRNSAGIPTDLIERHTGPGRIAQVRAVRQPALLEGPGAVHPLPGGLVRRSSAAAAGSAPGPWARRVPGPRPDRRARRPVPR